MQRALDSAALQAEQERLVRQWPQPLKNDGMIKVRVRTAQGHTVPLWVTYDRRKGQSRAGKRSAGVYAGLVLLGVYDRCTPALASEVSLFAAMLGSLAEAQDVLATRGVELDTQTVRLIASRYAARARLVPQLERTVFEDSMAGRRVVISSDGGRLRLRETKRGPEDVSQVWMCYSPRVSLQPTIPNVIEWHHDPPSLALSPLSRYGYCSPWSDPARQATVPLP